jgi:hypothetical protein
VVVETNTTAAVTNSLIVREPNLRFSPAQIVLVRELLCANLAQMQGINSSETIYARIVESFHVYGRERRVVPVANGSSWWRFVPVDLQQQLHELEADGQYLARDWSEG